MLVSTFPLLIDWTKIFRLSFFLNAAVRIVIWLKFMTSFKRLFIWASFLKTIHLDILLFIVLILIFVSLIVDLFVLRCVCKFYVGCIQIRHTNFLPPKDCGMLWQGFRLGVHTYSHQLIAFLDLKYPSSYLY